MSNTTEEQLLQEQIGRLENELRNVQAGSFSATNHTRPLSPVNLTLPSHPLLLLSDSALPLGSFAFSSGLESYLAHHNVKAKASSDSFPSFLILSLTSLATTTLPYLIATYRDPGQLWELDQTLDACTLCPVARRASVAQGKALLTLWERAWRSEAGNSAAKGALESLSKEMRTNPTSSSRQLNVFQLSGHFAPIWAAVTAAMKLSLHESAYTFLLNHSKAVISAAVRASVMGPYAAQGLLASLWLRREIERIMDECWEMKVEDAGQGVPMCDIWIGRHELLYSRIFNS